MGDEPDLEQMVKFIQEAIELRRTCKHDILTLRYFDVETRRTVYRCSECNHPFEWYREEPRSEVEKP